MDDRPVAEPDPGANIEHRTGNNCTNMNASHNIIARLPSQGNTVAGNTRRGALSVRALTPGMDAAGGRGHVPSTACRRGPPRAAAALGHYFSNKVRGFGQQLSPPASVRAAGPLSPSTSAY